MDHFHKVAPDVSTESDSKGMHDEKGPCFKKSVRRFQLMNSIFNQVCCMLNQIWQVGICYSCGTVMLITYKWIFKMLVMEAIYGDVIMNSCAQGGQIIMALAISLERFRLQLREISLYEESGHDKYLEII